MEEEKKKDYSSGYDVSINDESSVFTEYNSKKKEETLIPRSPSRSRAQSLLALFSAAAAVCYFFSYRIPSFRTLMDDVSPWNTVLSALFFIVSLFISSGGENRPMQLWLVSVCVPAFHYLMVWALNKAGGIFGVILLGLLFLVLAASLLFTLDHRVMGRNEYPFIAVLLPMYLLSFSYRGTLAEYAPAWYGKLLSFVQGLIILNAALATVLPLFRRKKNEGN